MPRIALALALALLASPAAAEREEGKWGAIAYGAPGRVAGTAVDFPTAAEARQAALESCGGRCVSWIVFARTCAAVAESSAGGAGSSISRWRGRAISRAVSACRRTGPDCTFVAWACTTH